MLLVGSARAARPGLARHIVAADVLAAEGDLAAARAELAAAPAPRWWAEALEMELARTRLEVPRVAPVGMGWRATSSISPRRAGGLPHRRGRPRGARRGGGRRPQAAAEPVPRGDPAHPPTGHTPPPGARGVRRRQALSERERTVLRYLATAMSYREIADDLYVSVNTVKTHVRNILRKLDADSHADKQWPRPRSAATSDTTGG